MDFLRVLATYNMRKIKEVMISSILNYLINPNEDHGLREVFLAKVIDSAGIIKYPDTKEAFWLPDKKNTAPEISVESEKYLGKGVGALDSLVTIKKNNTMWLIGIEVKIYDKSSKNTNALGEDQLPRYIEALASDDILIGDVSPVTKIERTLLYIVPGDGRTSESKAKEAHNANDKVKGPIVLPWSEPPQGFFDDITCATKSVSSLLKEILNKALYGEISPPDEHALSLMRSLRNAIGNKFNFTFEENIQGNFPTYNSFKEGMQEEGLRQKYSQLEDYLLKLHNYKKSFIDSGSRSLKIGVAVPVPDYKNTYRNEQLFQLIKEAKEIAGKEYGVIRFEKKYKGQDHWNLEKLEDFFKKNGVKVCLSKENDWLDLLFSEDTDFETVLDYGKLMKYRCDLVSGSNIN